MEAHYIGFNLWVKAVEKAKSTDVDKVLAALPGLETPNLTGGIAKMLPNHHITKPVYIGEVRADGQFDVVWKTHGHGAGRRLVGLPAGQQGHRGRLGDAEVRQLQHQDQGVLGTELQVTRYRSSIGAGAGVRPVGRRRIVLRASLAARAVLLRRSPAARAVAGRRRFRAALGELREASFADKEAIVERLIATRPSERARRC